MGLEELVGSISDMVSDFAGDIQEGIQDVTTDIAEFAQKEVENLGEQGMEALENGDIKQAIECSDIPEGDKKIAGKVLEHSNFNVLKSGLIIAGGALGTVAALATPGFQPAGLAAGAMLINGVKDLTSQLHNNRATANASWRRSSMMEFEKKLMDTVGEDYTNLIGQCEGVAGVHAANLVAGYGTDERKAYEQLVRIIEFSTQMLQVLPGKVKAAGDMPEEQIVKWTPHSETIQVNIQYLREKRSLEDARKLMIAVHTAVFIKHVRAVAESANETVREYAEKMGWYAEWKNAVDPYENPKRFFEQKYVKDALAYGILYTERAMQQAENVIQLIKEENHG